MSSITVLQSSDLISNSRADINTNFANLNSDKIETSVLDTDTTLAANSDSKIATQKAVKAYVDAGGNVNASETTRGIVEEATDAEVTAGTATGGTGAKLFVTPAKLATNLASVTTKAYTAGSLEATYAKTYFNFQFPFILWTGSTNGALTTDFGNWVRNSTDVLVTPGGAQIYFGATGADYIVLDAGIMKSPTSNLLFSDTKIVILDFWAILPASATGTLQMGFAGIGGSQALHTDSTDNRVTFAMNSSLALFASIAKGGTGASNTDISSGLTLTNWNNYRIELHLGTDAKFYVNGTLKATLSGANLPTSGDAVPIGFGRSNTSNYAVTAPNMSLQMI